MLFSGSSGASGIAGAAASGATAGAVFGPWGIAIGAVGGAVLGGIQAGKQNSRIKKAAKENQQNINKQEMQLQLGTLQANNAGGQAFRVAQGNTQNSVYSDSYRSGESLNAAFASNLGAQITNTKNTNINMQNQLDAMELQKRNIATQAQNQSTPIAMGAISGAQQGMAIAGQINQGVQAFQQLGINEARQSMQQGLMDDLKSYDGFDGPLSPDEQTSYNNSFDRLQALNAGVNPDLLSGGNASVVLKPFQQQRQMYELQMNRLTNEVAQSQARFGFDMDQRQRYMLGPLQQMGGQGQEWMQSPFIQAFYNMYGGGR